MTNEFTGSAFDLDSILEFQASQEIDTPDTPAVEEKTVETNEPDVDVTNDDATTPVVETTPTAPEVKTETDDTSDNVLTTYYDFLKEQDLIITPEDFKFDGTEESLEKAKVITLNAYKQKAWQELEEALPEEFKKVLKYGLEGGKSPLDLFEKQESTLDYDLSIRDNQVKVLKEHLKETTSFTDEKIERTIKRLENNDELEQEAYDALEELKEIYEDKKEKSIKDQQNALVAKEAKEKELRDKISDAISTNDIIAKERKTKVQAFMFNPIKKGTEVMTDYQRNLKNISNNPKHLVQLADILFDYDAEKGINLDRFKKQGESTANLSLKAKLESKMNSSKSSGSSSKTPHTIQQVDWDSLLG